MRHGKTLFFSMNIPGARTTAFQVPICHLLQSNGVSRNSSCWMHRIKSDGLEKALLQPYSDERSKTIAVFNTASWKISGPVLLTTGFNGRVGKSCRRYTSSHSTIERWPLHIYCTGMCRHWAQLLYEITQ